MTSRGSSAEDEHIALLLAREAKEASKKYSELGVRALLPTRPTTAAPKPNTRFLKNVIRETDNHNHALKKKEELEARLRLRAVNSASSASLDRHGLEEVRLGKRRRVEGGADYDLDRVWREKSRLHHENTSERFPASEDREERRRRRRRKRRNSTGGDCNRYTQRHSMPQHDEEYTQFSHQEKQRKRLQDLTDVGEQRHSHRQRKRRRSSLDHSSNSEELVHHHRHHPGEDRVASGHRDRDTPVSKQLENPRHRHRTRRSRSSSDDDVGSTMSCKNRTSPAVDPGSDSDPLEALVGPLPPPSKSTTTHDPPPLRSRGRGAYKTSSSAMDQHFTSTYNPSLDLHPDSEPDEEKEDWDMALEALRDREIWKRKGAERLRAAGFGDEEVKKWEDSGREKGAEDVKWTGKGEAREWDRGKVVEQISEKKGEHGLEEAWKRKGGGFLRDFKKALG